MHVSLHRHAACEKDEVEGNRITGLQRAIQGAQFDPHRSVDKVELTIGIDTERLERRSRVVACTADNFRVLGDRSPDAEKVLVVVTFIDDAKPKYAANGATKKIIAGPEKGNRTVAAIAVKAVINPMMTATRPIVW